VAFGVINNNEVTGGVLEEFRGQGIGKLLFKLLTDQVPKPATLEVLMGNHRARGLYESLGWKYSSGITLRGKSIVVHMEHE